MYRVERVGEYEQETGQEISLDRVIGVLLEACGNGSPSKKAVIVEKILARYRNRHA